MNTNLSGLPVGFAFGTLLEKSSVSAPETIEAQMAFKKHTMLKTFLTASGTTALALSILQCTPYGASLRITPTNVITNVVGGSLVGFGMTIGGSCPGTVLAQVGAGRRESLYTIAGGLIGGVTYGYLSKYIQQWVNDTTNYGNITLHGNTDFWKIGIPFAAAMYGMVYLVQKYLEPNKEILYEDDSPEEETPKEEKNLIGLFKKKTWDPIRSGIGIGLLQIPVNILTGGLLGTSSAYVAVMSKILSFFGIGKNNEYFQKIDQKKDSIFGILLDLGIIFGSFFSSKFSGNYKENRKRPPITWTEALKYLSCGFLLIFGARLADGCTSGHGLSGMPSQSISSYISVASMFAGGMGLSYLINKLKK